MSGNSAPKFCKDNQHFVPRFWIKRFAGSSGRILGRRRGEVRAFQVAAAGIMTGDWTYTVFDAWWRPSDALEDALSSFEGEAAKAMIAVDEAHANLDVTTKEKLCEVIAVSGCRLPWVMRRGHERMKKLATALSQIDEYDNDRQFLDDLNNRFGVELSDEDCEALRARPEDALKATARALNEISPQNRVFAEQEVLKGAQPIAVIMRAMDLTLLDTPAESLVLGDTPLPDSALAGGFLLPLSSKLLLCAQPAAGPTATFVRRAATPAEMEASNRFQFDSLLDIVVGPNAALLESL